MSEKKQELWRGIPLSPWHKVVIENKLRWEDDGGSILETNDSIPQVEDGEKQYLPN